ncbi:hypothetical protein HELRODRAFT_93352 [Helobdella robusta]|uniref:Protein-tyrosine-phosphatase n=1 Tax=Helobdella robusta TaxID=6412 RepID=T1G8V3_HELRO|nr:hypothetical protein HELRODRAFT_93352 [Helobdella robusta]ESO12587.1 hypothetical protein HELRODRAFT_93352 [Helobdella robusta]
MATTEISKIPSNSDLLGPQKAEVLKQMDITFVCDGLYLSDFESLSPEKIQKRNVTTVINAALEIPEVDIPGVAVKHLQVYDVATANINQHFDECADLIHATKQAGASSLVHCALGISRSVTICLAYLVKYENLTLREAYFMLKEKRHVIRPNDGFWKQLISYEYEKRGKSTVRMLVYPMGTTPDVYKNQTSRTLGFQRRK